MWLITLHSVFWPHDPGHGSRHLLLIHAKWYGHSLLIIHSGLQFGGEPINWGKQEHDGWPPMSWHWELNPHGDGTQGFSLNTSTGVASKYV